MKSDNNATKIKKLDDAILTLRGAAWVLFQTCQEASRISCTVIPHRDNSDFMYSIKWFWDSHDAAYSLSSTVAAITDGAGQAGVDRWTARLRRTIFDIGGVFYMTRPDATSDDVTTLQIIARHEWNHLRLEKLLADMIDLRASLVCCDADNLPAQDDGGDGKFAETHWTITEKPKVFAEVLGEDWRNLKKDKQLKFEKVGGEKARKYRGDFNAIAAAYGEKRADPLHPENVSEH